MIGELPDRDEVAQAVARKIRHNFLGVDFDIYLDSWDLEIVVSEKKRLKEIKEYCKWLQKHPLEPRVPVKITVKAA